MIISKRTRIAPADEVDVTATVALSGIRMVKYPAANQILTRNPETLETLAARMAPHYLDPQTVFSLPETIRDVLYRSLGYNSALAVFGVSSQTTDDVVTRASFKQGGREWVTVMNWSHTRLDARLRGRLRIQWPNDKMRVEYTRFRDGKVIGVWTTNEAGLLDGRSMCRSKNSDGSIWFTNWRAGREHGEALHYNDGVLVGVAHYYDGLLHGSVSRRKLDGWHTSTYAHGVEHGPRATWYPNGECATWQLVIDGRPSGPQVRWDIDGTLNSIMYGLGRRIDEYCAGGPARLEHRAHATMLRTLPKPLVREPAPTQVVRLPRKARLWAKAETAPERVSLSIA